MLPQKWLIGHSSGLSCDIRDHQHRRVADGPCEILYHGIKTLIVADPIPLLAYPRPVYGSRNLAYAIAGRDGICRLVYSDSVRARGGGEIYREYAVSTATACVEYLRGIQLVAVS